MTVKIGFARAMFRFIRYSTGFHATLLGVDIYFYSDNFYRY